MDLKVGFRIDSEYGNRETLSCPRAHNGLNVSTGSGIVIGQ